MLRHVLTSCRWAALLCAGCSLLQFGGCARLLSQELNVLFAANASTTLIGGSYLAGLLGPGILRLFN